MCFFYFSSSFSYFPVCIFSVYFYFYYVYLLIIIIIILSINILHIICNKILYKYMHIVFLWHNVFQTDWTNLFFRQPLLNAVSMKLVKARENSQLLVLNVFIKTNTAGSWHHVSTTFTLQLVMRILFIYYLCK